MEIQRKFKNLSFEKHFYMNDSDPIESIYSDLFGDQEDKKLLYEGMKLSKFLNAGEAGFFPGVNYIYLPEGERLAIIEDIFIILKLDSNSDNDIRMKFLSHFDVSDILNYLSSIGIDIKNKSLILNGEKLTLNTPLKNLIENDYSLDLVDNSLIENVSF